MSIQPRERWQAYSEQGEPLTTENGALTLVQAGIGRLHGAVHVWIWRVNDNGLEVMLQERALHEATWPGYLDASVGGHIIHGETPLQTAVREAGEELGLQLSPHNLRLLFVHRQRHVAIPTDSIDNELQWVYGHRLDSPAHFRSSAGEVDALHWLPLAELELLAQKGLPGHPVLPHGQLYFAELVRGIELQREDETITARTFGRSKPLH